MKSNAKTTKWNLAPIFKDDKYFIRKRLDLEKNNYAFIKKWKNRTDYLSDPIVLKEALDEYEKLNRTYGTYGDEGFYYSLRSALDENDPNIKAKSKKINEFSDKIDNDMLFFEMNISKIPKEEQKRFLDSPGLNKYRHYLERAFATAKYMLSEPEEKILNLKSNTSYSNWVQMLSGFLSKEERSVFYSNSKKKIMSFSEILALMDSKNKKVRDSAANAFNDILKKNSDSAEAEMNSILENKKIDDELRKIKRPDLTRHISDDIDSEIVDSMIECTAERYDISRRYYRLKARLLGVKKLRYHERNLEYGRITKKYSYDVALNLVSEVFSKLDPEFSDILNYFSENGRIDVYPKLGKSHGAFCADSLISQPVYVLLNHDESIRSVLTFAHEMGHAINSTLMQKRVNSLNFDTPLSTAEVASTFMENFVLQELLTNADDELKLSILMMKLDSDVSTIFRQVACYRFELELHSEFRKRGYLSKEAIGIIFMKHMKSYMGDSIELSPGCENWWIYWEHIRQFFYVYSYASGILISKSLQNSTRKDKRFISKVKEFLSSGETRSPKDLFLSLDIDISDRQFWKKGIEEVEELLRETTILAKKLKKI
ncbi:MAG: M3 family oligoendopeptidase [archaeon]